MTAARDMREVRDEMIADYKGSVERQGVTPEMRDIERIVQSDLGIYDAVEREKRAAPAAKPAVPDEREDTAAAIARDHGMDLYRQVDPKERFSPLLDTNPHRLGPKSPFMMGRIRRIVATPPGVRPRTMREMVALCEYPKLAREFFSLWFFYNHPDTPHRANPFFGMSQRDRARCWIRKVEDICDKSSGQLGPWWVPK